MVHTNPPHTLRVAARSRNETLIKLYMDSAVYKELAAHARPLCISVRDLVRAVIAEKFPNVPTEDIPIGQPGQRAPKPMTDNREEGDKCGHCGHTWGAHNYGAQGDELPDGGPCIECDCARFV